MKYFRESRERIEKLILGLVREGYEDLSILLLDPKDLRAQRIAGISGDPNKITYHLCLGRRPRLYPTMEWCMSRCLAAAILAGRFPEVSAMVAAPGIPGGYAVVVVSGGSESVIELPPIEMRDGTAQPEVKIKS
jgi:hypothetical protein